MVCAVLRWKMITVLSIIHNILWDTFSQENKTKQAKKLIILFNPLLCFFLGEIKSRASGIALQLLG